MTFFALHRFVPHSRLLAFCAVACLGLFSASPFSAQIAAVPKTMRKAPTPSPLLLGAAWYPEQWPESRWEKDLELMQKAHIHVVRMGEYTWSEDETPDGRYTLDWLERAIDMAGRHGIFVVLGTPSQAPPAWLMEKYPEILRLDRQGCRTRPGYRANFNWADPKYRILVRQIDEQLAKRFGHNPYVIAWQIDNEYGNVSYGPIAKAQFDQWLQRKYGTLANLNRRLNLAYWSNIYTAWNQIEIPHNGANPGLMLDWMHFVTDTWRSYQQNQIDALRMYISPRQRITSNMMGWYDGFNQYELAKEQDFAAVDDPLGAWGSPFNPVENAAKNDFVRGLKDRNYWVMETTAKSNMAKGEMRAAVWQDVGHGAMTTSYWQWRDGLNGQEQNHKGVLCGVDGTPSPEYSEWAQVGSDYEKAGAVLKGTTVHARVALLLSYDSRWAINWHRLNNRYDPLEALLSYYRPLHALGYSVAIVSPSDDLSRYKVVFAPGLNVIPQGVADNLMRYVQGGGNLVLGQRSGMKDGDNSRWPERQPGALEPMLGGRVEQYFALKAPVPVSGTWGAGEDMLYAERLQVMAPGVRVLMRYGKSNGWLDGSPAAITRKVGAGSISYVGIWMDAEGLRREAEWFLAKAGVRPDLPLVPKEVEVERRTGGGKDVLLFQNFSPTEQSIPLPGPMRNVLAGGNVTRAVLPQYGVAVLEASAGASAGH